MIKELNEKIDFSNQTMYPKNYKFTNFTDIQPFVDSYFSINFENHPHTINMSNNFVVHMTEYFKLEHFHILYRDRYATQISNHKFFTMLIYLVSQRMNYELEFDLRLEDNEFLNSIPKDAKYYMFSAHDTTLTSILAGFDHKHVNFPVYASSIIIELHQNETGHYYLQFKYDGELLDVSFTCGHHLRCTPQLVFSYLQKKLLSESYETACLYGIEDEHYGHSSGSVFVLKLLMWFVIIFITL